MVDHLLGLKEGVKSALLEVYGHEVQIEDIVLQLTKKEFNGDYTLVVFPYTKVLRSKPELIAEKLGAHIVESLDIVSSFNVIKGFLNFELSTAYWIDTLSQINAIDDIGRFPSNGQKVSVEFSSPNTNKPLHLGHIRNILLGWSTSQILQTAGYDVVNTQIINDRGIAICKSMLAWDKFAAGAEPQSTGTKGDHFVGQYYIEFENRFRQEYLEWQESKAADMVFKSRDKKDLDKPEFFKSYKNEYFNEHSALGREAKAMLLKWEANDPEVRSLWAKMNGWVYDGFNQTYSDLGVSFDTLYYESDTYLLGKDIIRQGLDSDNFYRKEDGSVWVDLTDRGLDNKILLRSDGTSVYMTQDLGTAQKRYDDLETSKMIYVVADEQDYHFQVLFEIMKKLETPFASGMYHLSYGMVDLPSGRMKSREGRVVDADDLIVEVIGEVEKAAKERGELTELTETERKEIYRKIGLSALKFFILKVNPQKRMTFNPEESVDMQGQTGPYIQNAYVRIQSVKRRLNDQTFDEIADYAEIDPTEIEILKSLITYEEEILKAAEHYDPSGIANYSYELAKKYHKFYHDVRILKAETKAAKSFRLMLSHNVAKVLKHSMHLLGIEMPERM